MVTPESPTAGSCGYAWSGIGGGVTSRGDGVGDGDNDSEGVELVECYTPAMHRDIKGKGHVSVVLTDEKEAAPRLACTMAGGTGASAR